MNSSAPDICIYHANCDDGFAAAYAVWKRFGDGVKFIPAQYGGDIPEVSGKDVLIVDFSFKQPDMQQLADKAKRIIVLDHHKTAEAELSGFTRLECVGGPFEKRYADRMTGGVGVCFDMNKSGCRLAWEYCFGDEPMPEWFAAVEDRDLWRFALPATKEICISIRSHPRDFKIWDGFDAGELAVEGTAIRRYVDMIVSNICDTAFVENIGGHEVPVAACSYDFVSETANQLLQRNPDAPFAACLVRSYDGVTYSLRSMDDRMDVSEIAKTNGGGGHRNAAGFRAKVAAPQTNTQATSDVIILVKKGDPSEKPMLYACPKCGQAHSPKIYACREEQAHEAARRAAEECWNCRTHDECQSCGKETPKGWMKCDVCRESAKLQKATVVDAATIENCFDADGEYYHDTDMAADHGASYVYASAFTPYRIDFESLIDNVLDDHHEDASTHDLKGFDALKAAIDAFNEAQTSGSYYEDSSKVAYLRKPDGADATTEGQP